MYIQYTYNYLDRKKRKKEIRVQFHVTVINGINRARKMRKSEISDCQAHTLLYQSKNNNNENNFYALILSPNRDLTNFHVILDCYCVT